MPLPLEKVLTVALSSSAYVDGWEGAGGAGDSMEASRAHAGKAG
jgi:hypothetical protein